MGIVYWAFRDISKSKSRTNHKRLEGIEVSRFLKVRLAIQTLTSPSKAVTLGIGLRIFFKEPPFHP